ncbi:MAG: histidine phosphatase family protein [Polyangiaceae bacterium]
MSQLLLVRHGQASFLAANYDELSAQGREQSRLLGVHWRSLGLRIDRAICGPRRRQRDTARLCLDALSPDAPIEAQESRRSMSILASSCCVTVSMWQ